MIEFRALTADEVECRVNTVGNNGVSLLLYKDARADMKLLDETVGAMNWQRHHSRDNANCTISIWDEDKKQWVSKEDTGTESYTEKEKGLASDSFKRAGTNWGIGRELYTAPFIWVDSSDVKIEQKNGKNTTYDTFSVVEMKVDQGVIVQLKIKNNRTNKTVFEFGENKVVYLDKEKQSELMHLVAQTNSDFEKILKSYKVNNLAEMSLLQYENCKKILLNKVKKE